MSHPTPTAATPSHRAAYRMWRAHALPPRPPRFLLTPPLHTPPRPPPSEAFQRPDNDSSSLSRVVHSQLGNPSLLAPPPHDARMGCSIVHATTTPPRPRPARHRGAAFVHGGWAPPAPSSVLARSSPTGTPRKKERPVARRRSRRTALQLPSPPPPPTTPAFCAASATSPPPSPTTSRIAWHDAARVVVAVGVAVADAAGVRAREPMTSQHGLARGRARATRAPKTPRSARRTCVSARRSRSALDRRRRRLHGRRGARCVLGEGQRTPL